MILFIGNRIERKTGRKIGTATHPFTEIVYYHSGIQCDLTIEDKSFKAVGGCISVIPENTRHSEDHYSDGSVSYIPCKLPVSLPAGLYTNMNHVAYIFDSLALEFKNQSPYFSEVAELYLELLCNLILRSGEEKATASKDLSYIKRFIEENFTENISVTSLAHQIGYSSDRFRHLFAETYGISPQKMIINLRLQNARELLDTSSLSCSEIGQKCGFYDASQFARMFAAEYGLSPSKYRKEQLEND